MVKSKICTKCGKQKLFSEFYKDKSGKHGVKSECKKCNIIRAKKYNNAYKAKRLEYAKIYNHTHRIERTEYDRKYRKTIMGHLRHCFYDMRRRCNNLERKDYNRYGGRGIKCLFESVNEFVNYVIAELRIDPRGLQIDRIDNDGHYERGNVRFVTSKVNNNNRRKRKCLND